MKRRTQRICKMSKKKNIYIYICNKFRDFHNPSTYANEDVCTTYVVSFCQASSMFPVGSIGDPLYSECVQETFTKLLASVPRSYVYYRSFIQWLNIIQRRTKVSRLLALMKNSLRFDLLQKKRRKKKRRRDVSLFSKPC